MEERTFDTARPSAAARKWRTLCLGVILYNLVTVLGSAALIWLAPDGSDLEPLATLCPLLMPALALSLFFDASDAMILALTLPVAVLPLVGWLLFRRNKPLGAALIRACGYLLLVCACLLLFLAFFLLGIFGFYFLLQLGLLFFASIFMLISLGKWVDAMPRRDASP